MASHQDLRCPHCPALEFRRQENFQRHLASHTDHRPYNCVHCDSSFNRSDALKRHLNTCRVHLEHQKNEPTSDASLPKRKRRRLVCDSCAKLRIKCSLGTPCDGCRVRGRVCAYSHDRSSNDTPTSEGLPSLGPGGSFSPLSIVTAGGMPFVNSTASSAGLAECFGHDRLDRTIESADDEATGFEFQLYDLPDQDNDGWLLDPANDHSETLTPGTSTGCLQESPASTWSTWTPPVDPLKQITSDIIHSLRNSTITRSQGSLIQTDWSPEREQTCASFFSPPNIRTYQHLFWRYWYPHCPILHKVSFDIHRTPLPLAISMLLIGAQFSEDESTRTTSRTWFDVVEELVFNDQCFKDAVTTCESLQQHCKCGVPLLKHVQAALLVCVVQNWEGSSRSKMRIRRYRYGMIVAAARYINPALASHKELSFSQFDWPQFIKTEETIRTLHFILCLDAMFMIFYNIPPQLTVRELKMDLISPEICFQANSAELCLLCLQELTPKESPLSVARALELTCHETVDENLQCLNEMDKLNLVTIIYGIHILIFYFKASLVFDTAMHPIMQGLQRWKRLWDTPSAVDVYRLGQLQYASEFWTMANIMISEFHAPVVQRAEHMQGRYDTPDMQELTRLLREYDLKD